MKTYTIEQPLRGASGHYELIPEGEFDTREAAEEALDDLERTLGWAGLRIVERERLPEDTR